MASGRRHVSSRATKYVRLEAWQNHYFTRMLHVLARIRAKEQFYPASNRMYAMSRDVAAAMCPSIMYLLTFLRASFEPICLQLSIFIDDFMKLCCQSYWRECAYAQ